MQTLSIITPSYNQLDWLRLCILSVQNQLDSLSTNGSIEHIVQDAGTLEIQDFARAHNAEFFREGIRIFGPNNQSSPQQEYMLKIFSEKDSGMYDAINRGLHKSSGAICAWLNSDEQYLEGTLESVRRYFETDDHLDVLLGDAILVDHQLTPVCYRRIMVPSVWHTRLLHLHSLSCAMFFKRSALPDPPLDPKWKVIGDAVLMDYFIRARKRIKACGKPLSIYAFTGQNLSANQNGILEHTEWQKHCFFPTSWLRPLVAITHRFRRFFNGAYTPFKVSFTYEGQQGKLPWSGVLSGRWPKFPI